MTIINSVYVIGIVAIALLVWIIVLEYRLRKLLRGKTGDDLEDLVGGQVVADDVR